MPFRLMHYKGNNAADIISHHQRYSQSGQGARTKQLNLTQKLQKNSDQVTLEGSIRSTRQFARRFRQLILGSNDQEESIRVDTASE